MRGHETIIRMRERGKKPVFVFLNDWPCDTNWFETGHHATICTAGDPIASLDLRCLIGLRVNVCANSEERAQALFEACKAAGVELVAAVHVKPGKHPADQDGWVGIWRAEKEVAHG